MLFPAKPPNFSIFTRKPLNSHQIADFRRNTRQIPSKVAEFKGLERASVLRLCEKRDFVEESDFWTLSCDITHEVCVRGVDFQLRKVCFIGSLLVFEWQVAKNGEVLRRFLGDARTGLPIHEITL